MRAAFRSRRPVPGTTIDLDEVRRQVLATWRRHNDILLFLLAQVPAGGLAALPAGSRGRTVALQFAHLDRVRRSWLAYHRTGKRQRKPRVDRARPPSRTQLKRSLAGSGRAVERFLDQALHGSAHPRYFGGEAIRWLGYLIAHESHHRGQIMLALKQSGFRLAEAVALQGVWRTWIWGK